MQRMIGASTDRTKKLEKIDASLQSAQNIYKLKELQKYEEEAAINAKTKELEERYRELTGKEVTFDLPSQLTSVMEKPIPNPEKAKKIEELFRYNDALEKIAKFPEVPTSKPVVSGGKPTQGNGNDKSGSR